MIVMCQVWYLIVSIPDLCNLITFLPRDAMGLFAVCDCGIC